MSPCSLLKVQVDSQWSDGEEGTGGHGESDQDDVGVGDVE